MFLNRSILIGRLTKDPETRFTQSGKQVTRFTLAVDRPFTNQETGQRETDFIPIAVWGKQAEFCANYLSKGRLVALEGRIQVRSYVDPSTGENRTFTEVVADAVRFLDKKNGNQPEAGDELPGEAGDNFPPVDDFNFDDEAPPF